MNEPEQRLHATCISLAGRGILLTGPSGAGKSDLALRMICQQMRLPPCRETGHDPGAAMAATLVADDQVILRRQGDSLVARAPGTLTGLLEVRGLGIIRVDNLEEARINLVVALVPREAVERMPPEEQTVDMLGRTVPLCRLYPFDATAPVKVALASRSLSTIS